MNLKETVNMYIEGITDIDLKVKKQAEEYNMALLKDPNESR